ncbi:MAG: glycosyltransferase [Leeuwenhoekiella sp.]
MITIIIVLILGYCCLVIALCVGFNYLKEDAHSYYEPKISFSICIAFRNESNNLFELLNSLKDLSYPDDLFEILLVDDHSNDNSVEIIADFCKKNARFGSKIRVLRQKTAQQSGKKSALTNAIQNAKNEFIITTDADCLVNRNWLHGFNTFIISSRKTFIAAPVALEENSRGILNSFQQLDFLSLQGATVGGFGIKKPFLCNGANLCFSKSRFFELKGYEGNDQIASGDDLFLMQKFLKNDREAVGYLKSKNAIVYTKSQKNCNQLINQRKRWAAKASHFKDPIGVLVSWIVFLGNVAFVLAVLYLSSSIYLLILIVLKTLADFLLIAQSADFFSKKNHLSGFLISFIIHPFFTIYIAVASQFQTFKWKGRRLKK